MIYINKKLLDRKTQDLLREVKENMGKRNKHKKEGKCMQKEDELDAQEAYERDVQNYMDYLFQDEEEAACRNER